MALRFKCKCGRVMKIPAAQAGKNLRCPGCRKVFKIPLEKFQALAEKAPPPDAPAAAPPALEREPMELEVIPSELDLGVPAAQPVEEAPVAAAVAVATAPMAGYAADRPWAARGSRLDMDVIQAPTRSYWADALRAFGYPFISANNGVVFGMILFAECARILMGVVFPYLPCFVGPVMLIAMIGILGWIAAIMLSVIQDTASGSEDLPGIKVEDGAMEDVIKPLFKYVGAWLCAILPTLVYVALVANGVLSGARSWGLNLILLSVVALFLLPMFLMLFAFNAPAQVFRLDLVFTTIIRTFLPYMSIWLMLLLANLPGALELLGWAVMKLGIALNVPQVPRIPGLAGTLIYSAVDLYLSIVSMRVIGLYYLHFKRRFTLVME